MKIFKKLTALRDLERRHLPFLESLEDRDLVWAIGDHQRRGIPLTLAGLLALHLGSPSTIQRRLARLREHRVVRQRRSRTDRRANILSLSPVVTRAYRRLESAFGRADD